MIYDKFMENAISLFPFVLKENPFFNILNNTIYFKFAERQRIYNLYWIG